VLYCNSYHHTSSTLPQYKLHSTLTRETFEYLGRLDTQVKIRGFKIELGEVQNALLALEMVKQAVVINVEHAGNKTLAAFLVREMSESGWLVDDTAIRAQLSSTLPDYMIPASFNQIEQVPLTLNGKLDKYALLSPAWVDGDQYTAPCNEVEAELCAIWQQVLGFGKEKVGINDNFFRIGGDSIVSITLVSKLPHLRCFVHKKQPKQQKKSRS
jgi:hypothetical protein